MTRTVLFGALLVALGSLGAIAAPDAEPDLVGTYRCDGVNPDGTKYRGVVEIAKIRDTFRIRWTLDDAAIMGVGILSDGVFAVSYFGGAPAVVLYRVDGTSLVGKWTMGGIEGAVYAETLTKTSSEEPSLRGPNPHQHRQQPAPSREPTKPGETIKL